MMTDTEMINELQRLNDEKAYTGTCVLRHSSTGRGWRLHETSIDEGFSCVRQAIIDFVEKEKEKCLTK